LLYTNTYTVDSDGDSIVDNLDLCPNLPENYNNFLDTDGCPDDPTIIDSDQDGYSDLVDECPDEPENYNGFADTDGCPDKEIPLALFSYQLPDNDSDGVDDRWDQCGINV